MDDMLFLQAGQVASYMVQPGSKCMFSIYFG